MAAISEGRPPPVSGRDEYMAAISEGRPPPVSGRDEHERAERLQGLVSVRPRLSRSGVDESAAPISQLEAARERMLEQALQATDARSGGGQVRPAATRVHAAPPREQLQTGTLGLLTRTVSALAQPEATPAKEARGDAMRRTNTAEGEIPTCGICLADPCKPGEREVSTTPCGHVFCVQCLATAIAIKPVCPLCRGPVPPAERPAAPLPAPPLTGPEAEWYAAQHRRHEAFEAREAIAIRRLATCVYVCTCMAGVIPMVVFCYFYLTTVAEFRADTTLYDSCMTSFDARDFSRNETELLVDSNAGQEWPVGVENDEGDYTVFCEFGDIDCLEEHQEWVAERWSDLLQFVHMMGAFDALRALAGLYTLGMQLNRDVLVQHPKMAGLGYCCICCGVVVPYVIFFVHAAVAFASINSWCDEDPRFARITTLLYARWIYVTISLVFINPMLQRVAKHSINDYVAFEDFEWKPNDPVILTHPENGVGAACEGRVVAQPSPRLVICIFHDHPDNNINGRPTPFPMSALTIPESVRNHRGLQNVENARSASGDAHFAWHYVRKVEQPDEMELYLHGRAGAGRVGFSYRHHYEYNRQDRAAP